MINNDKLIELLKAAIELTESTVIEESTEFKKLEEWDSLSAMSIIAMLHKEYGLIIGAEEMNSFNIIADIINYVKLNGK